MFEFMPHKEHERNGQDQSGNSQQYIAENQSAKGDRFPLFASSRSTPDPGRLQPPLAGNPLSGITEDGL